MKPNLGFLGLVDWELCLLEVGQFYGWLLAILTTVQWCQVAQKNTRYVPSRYTHHILPHIGHWWPFGNNWWSTISSPSFRSFLGVDLTHLIKPSVLWSALNFWTLWTWYQEKKTFSEFTITQEFCLIFQVSWLKRHGDTPHLLTFGLTTYSSDSRFQIFHEQPNDWKLQIQFPQLSDQGIYECLVSTNPPLVRRTRLAVIGE